MSRLLQLVRIACLTAAFSGAASFSSAAYAQITNPDNLVAPPPRPPGRQPRTDSVGDAQWMWQFTRPAPNGQADSLRLDSRFQQLLHNSFKQPQSMWGPPESPQPLALLIPVFLTKYGAVSSDDNRFISVDGCVPSFCPASGLLWFDLGRPHPLIVFAATNWTTEGHTTDEPSAEYNLYLFPNRTLDANALPLALTEAIAHWNIRLASAHRLVPHIVHAVLIEPDGSQSALDPQMTGANTIAAQPDTLTPPPADN